MENEKELLEKINVAKKIRATECMEKIEIILKEFNCSITTDVQVNINGQFVNPMIQAL